MERLTKLFFRFAFSQLVLEIYVKLDCSIFSIQLKSEHAEPSELLSQPVSGSQINLSNFLDRLGTFERCFIAVDNIFNYDITPTRSAISVRKYNIGFLNITEGDKSNVSPLWIPPNVNVSFRAPYPIDWPGWDIISIPCKSPLLAGKSQINHQTYCTSYELKAFTRNSKPWNCEIFLNLFYPIHFKSYRGMTSYPTVFHTDDFYYNLYYSIWPSSQPSVIILVQQNIAKLHPFYYTMLANTRSFSFQKPTIYTEHHILMEAKAIRQLSLQPVVFNHYESYLLCYCMFCKGSMRLVKLKNISNTQCNPPEETLNIFVSDFSAEGNRDKLIDYVDECSTKNWRYWSSKILATEKLLRRFATEILLLVGNYTTITRKNVMCSNGKIKTLTQQHNNIDHIYVTTISHEIFNQYLPANTARFHYSFKDAIHTMRFVSCGYRGTSPYPFYEFVNIYEFSVWIITFGFVLLLPALICLLGTTHAFSMPTYFHYFDGVFRVLIGLDFPCIARTFHVRFVLMTYCLACIVLNNAYKSENILRMIQPREILPYKTISQLKQDNFSIYTRINKVFVEHWVRWDDRNVVNKNHNFQWEWNTKLVEVVDDLSDTDALGRNAEKLEDKDVLLLSHLQPLIANLVEPARTYLNNISMEASNVQFSNKLLAFVDWFINNYNNILESSLRNCSRTAVVGPGYLVAQLAKKLIHSNFENARHLDISDQTYFQALQAFKFYNVVPSHIRIRLKVLQTSHLFEWWYKVVAEATKVDINKIETLGATTMAGNILVVFVVWLIGQTLAAAAIFLERSLTIYMVVWKSLVNWVTERVIVLQMAAMASWDFKVIISKIYLKIGKP